MKLKISFVREDTTTLPKISFNAEMKKTDLAGAPWTTNSLFLDFLNTPHAKNYELKKWKIRRNRDKWNGLASEKSPELKDDDEISFYAVKKADA